MNNEITTSLTRSASVKAIIASLLLSVCLQAWAEKSLFHGAAFFDYISSYENSLIGLVAPRYMDDETLIRSAKMRRENTMSSEQRMMNSLWLAQGHYGDNHLRDALKTEMRKSIRSFLKQQYQSEKNVTEPRGIEAEKAGFAVSNIENYDLRISNEKFILMFEHKF